MSDHGPKFRKRSGYKVVDGKSEPIREDDVSSTNTISTKCPICSTEFPVTIE